METKADHNRCLILNADYTPIGIVHWHRAIIWGLKSENTNSQYSIEIIDFYKNDFIQGISRRFPVPAVARIHRFLSLNNRTVNFNRKNILIRDAYTCQYCNNTFNINQLTYDHVIPKSKWSSNTSPTNWTNIVTCCVECNRKKGNRTPTQAGMKLLKIPVRPKSSFRFLPFVESLTTIKSIPDEWAAYLPQSYEHL
jgi:5-methylcytosine-specific restriction endonuclease McrA